MQLSSTSRLLRALIIPAGVLLGLFAAPALMLPSATERLRAGKFVDGTGYGFAGIFGLLAGMLVGYIVRTALDHSLWWSRRDDADDRAA